MLNPFGCGLDGGAGVFGVSILEAAWGDPGMVRNGVLVLYPSVSLKKNTDYVCAAYRTGMLNCDLISL